MSSRHDREVMTPPSPTTRSEPRILSNFMRWMFTAGVGAAAVGVALDIYLRYSGNTAKPLVSMKDLLFPNAEANLFSWFSATALAAIAIGFAVHALAAWGAGRAYWPFVVLAIVAISLSADEAAMLHERLDGLALWLGLSLSWSYQWLLIGVPFAVAVGVLLLWLARSLDPVLRKRLVIAGVIFLAGAVGGEVLGGVITKVDLGLSRDLHYLLHTGAVFFEEALEICGTLIALWAVLAELPLRPASGAVSATSTRGID